MLDLKQVAMKKTCIVLALVGVTLWAQTAPVPPAVPADSVVLKIDGKDLTAGEIRALVNNMPGDFGKFYQQNPKNAIEQLYVMRFLAQEAEKEKLDQQSPMKEQLEMVRANALASAMLSYEHNHFPVSEEMVKDYYQRNQAKYQQSKIKAIFVAFKPVVPAAGASIEDVARAASEAATGRTQRSEAEARKLAEDLVKQVREGADFGKLVEQYSDDPASKAKGGDLGVVSVTSGQPADLKRAVLPLKAGEVTDPIRQLAGFYIIHVEEKTAQTMTEVYEPILQEIRQEHVNQWFAAIRTRFTGAVENPQFFARPVPIVPAPVPVPPVPPATAK
jgi:parvulin-like peptidyl-prolyl isomerase